MENRRPIYFVIGTRAQFIKVAPVMRAMVDREIPYTLIYTAQHRENIHEVLDVYGLPSPDIVLYEREEANTKTSFVHWFLTLFSRVVFQSKKYIPEPGYVLTHGDTFTAWLGALMGRRAGCQVGHIESGCRSHNIFSPFPEEISRLITFQFTDLFFCADDWALNNVRQYRGKKISMGANTLLDGVRFALQTPYQPRFAFEAGPFAIVSIHRFENIFTPRLTERILPLLFEIANDHHLVFTVHPATRERLRALGLYEQLSEHPNITLHERFDFIDWIHICNRANFVITDGGSNQEELSYLGVPTLLFRHETERQEGLDKNVVISKFDAELIRQFVKHPERYRFPAQLTSARPSQTIIETLCGKPAAERSV